MSTLCKSDSKLDPTPLTWKQHAGYQFRYISLPESVLHRLMIYCFANLRPGKRWRKGFWLECEAQGLSAVIRSTGRESEENVLQIDVYAQNEQYEAWIWLQPLCQQIIAINDTLSLKSVSYVLAENDQEKTWFKLDSVWHWKKQGSTTLQGERSLFQIQPLMDLVYGRYYPDVERRLMEDQDKHQLLMSPETFSQTITSGIAELTEFDLSKPLEEQFLEEMKRINDLREQTNAAIERHADAIELTATAIQRNTFALEQSNELLQAIRDGKVTLPPEIMDVLVKAFQQSDVPTLTNTGNKMERSIRKGKSQLLRDLLGDAANIATVAPILVQLGEAYGPVLLELLMKLPVG